MKDIIEKIRFQKYKSFSESVKHELDIMKPTCLVIGRNSSGKSSLIDILEFVFNSVNRKQAELMVIQNSNIELGLTLTEDHLGAFNSNVYTGWTSLWLFYYELWLQTGEWLGGGIHCGKGRLKKGKHS